MARGYKRGYVRRRQTRRGYKSVSRKGPSRSDRTRSRELGLVSAEFVQAKRMQGEDRRRTFARAAKLKAPGLEADLAKLWRDYDRRTQKRSAEFGFNFGGSM